MRSRCGVVRPPPTPMSRMGWPAISVATFSSTTASGRDRSFCREYPRTMLAAPMVRWLTMSIDAGAETFLLSGELIARAFDDRRGTPPYGRRGADALKDEKAAREK